MTKPHVPHCVVYTCALVTKCYSYSSSILTWVQTMFSIRNGMYQTLSGKHFGESDTISYVYIAILCIIELRPSFLWRHIKAIPFIIMTKHSSQISRQCLICGRNMIQRYQLCRVPSPPSSPMLHLLL